MSRYIYNLRQNAPGRHCVLSRDIVFLEAATGGEAFYTSVYADRLLSDEETNSLGLEPSVTVEVKEIEAVERAAADSARQIYPRLSNEELARLGFDECLKYP